MKRTSLLLFVLLFASYACDLSSLNLTGGSPAATSLAQTLSVILTSSLPAASATPSATSAASVTTTVSPTAPTSTPEVPSSSPLPTLTSTITLTPSLTPSPIPTSTHTPIVPLISVSVPTNCREGPGIPFEIVGALLVGEKAQVIAVDPTRTFWYIPNPDSPGDYCWVWGQYATISGATLGLPVYTPQPTPTSMVTSTPAPDFDFSFEGLVTCSSASWLQFKIKNTGDTTFQSIGLTIKDTDTDSSASVISDNFYDQSDCSTSTSRASLLPGKSVTVSPVVLGYDPSGHKLKVSVTLCSQDGQNGICSTGTISVKP